jgi:predicted Zn-dependent protease
MVPDSQMDEMGAQAFQQVKASEKLDNDPKVNQYVSCVVDPLLQSAKGKTPVQTWEIKVFNSPQANAFALPGGKIGVYSGLLKVAKTPDQLAAVMGHEVGHVIARHSAERVSQQAGTEVGLSVLGAITPGNPNKNTLMSLLGLGAQVGILLPFSRTQESEADIIGLNLMAESGFDPEESIELWRNMAKAGGSQPPEWLSTHPANESRIANLQKNIPKADITYAQARALGHVPHCSPPKL